MLRENRKKQVLEVTACSLLGQIQFQVVLSSKQQDRRAVCHMKVEL